MKKILMILACCMLLCGCGGPSGVSQEEYDRLVAERDELKEQLDSIKNLEEEAVQDNEDQNQPEDDTEPEKEEDGTEKESGNVEMVAEYTLPDGINWYTRHFIVIKNNSEETVDVSTSSLAYSSDGTMVAAKDADFDALGAGCTSVMYEAFETDATIDHYETELKSSPSKYHESVIQDLSYVQNDIDKGAVFQVTNNGEDVAEFVEGYALFFSGENLIGYDSAYFTDDDSELKPGETISKQLTSYDEFDRIEFYLTGRK